MSEIGATIVCTDKAHVGSPMAMSTLANTGTANAVAQAVYTLATETCTMGNGATTP